MNFGRAVMFSTAPTFPFVAAIMSGYKVLSTKENVCAFLFLFLFLFFCSSFFYSSIFFKYKAARPRLMIHF